MPAPAHLAQLDKNVWSTSFGLMNVTALGARAFERLGHSTAAAETARLGLAQQKQRVVLADCHRVLGRIAAARGEVDAAASFLAAIDEARAAGAHLVMVLAAAELGSLAGWRAEADAVIDAACTAMQKPRAAFAEVMAAATLPSCPTP